MLLLAFQSNGTIITGRVTDVSNRPLPFANVYIKGTTHGTNTNDDGVYAISVEPGKHQLVFKYLGYKTITREVTAEAEKITLDVTLEVENYQIAEVVISSNAEDPAYAIIRNAQKKRKFYLEQVNSFSCDVYIKGVQKLTKYPKKILGQEINFEGMLDTATGIIYLSESVSKFYFKKPDLTKEHMISSKVSGSNKAFSFNQNAMMQYNFYNNMVGEGGLSERGFVSPIASSAMLYYKYKLVGTFTENNQQIEKIEVIPIRPTDPSFRGYINIVDSTWRIHSLDLVLTKESQLQFVDTLRLEQVYLPVGGHEDIWMPVSGKFSFTINLFGFEGAGSFIGINSNFEIDPQLDKNFFDGEVLKINKDANLKDMNYWLSMRPVPLSNEESVDYIKKDSMEVIRESKPYKDSLDRESNKITAGKILLTGYTYRQRYKNQEFNFSPLLRNVQFNTVEGLRVGLNVDYTKSYENRKSWSISPQVSYGFANETYQASVRFRYNYNPLKFAAIIVEGGQDAVQYNNQNPILPVINTAYTLFGEQNYMKLYQKRYLFAEHKSEIINGLNLSLSMGYYDRLPMVNHTDYTLIDKEGREYTSNDPQYPDDALNQPPFERNQLFIPQVLMRIRFKQKYISRPDNKFILGSKYPTLLITYRKAFNKVLGSDSYFDYIKIGVEDEMRLGIFGSMEYNISYANFPGSKKVEFINYEHYLGNQTVISSFNLSRYNLLDYYTHSNDGESVQGHLEHSFNGFILNKIPLMRRLKLNEIAGFHYLYVNGLPGYYEYSIGFEKLGLIRIDYVSSFAPNTKPVFGVVVGFALLQ